MDTYEKPVTYRFKEFLYMAFKLFNYFLLFCVIGGLAVLLLVVAAKADTPDVGLNGGSLTELTTKHIPAANTHIKLTYLANYNSN